MKAYCEDDLIIEPPCYADNMYDIFEAFIHTGFNMNKETPLEKLQDDFPYIANENLLKLIEYFKSAIEYCEGVCCVFATIYPYVVIPNTDKAHEDIKHVINACKKRYPWIKPEYISSLLVGVVAMCNR